MILHALSPKESRGHFAVHAQAICRSNRHMRRKLVSILFLLLGLALMGAAVFATMLGLDHNPEWGRGRIGALILGVLIASGGALDYRYPEFAAGAKSKLESLIENHPLALWIRSYRFTLPAVLPVLLAYVWFISAGLWTTWPPRTSYYAFLAQGFRKGELSVSIQPDPGLVQLSDPYDPVARDAVRQQGIHTPPDYSLYKGKFYLYFGPVPAVILAALHPLLKAKITDLYLVFGFVCGMFLSQFLMLIAIWERFFRSLPKWLLLMSILVVGLSAPSTIPLNNPTVYEAAISGGQFFLIGGFLMALGALEGPVPSGWRLALAGTLWALAIGTRLILGVSIGFLVLMVSYWILRTNRRPFDLIKRLTPLVLPLMFGALCLGWYNWARFGSVFETGFSYALAGVNLRESRSLIFSPIYILQNLYNYVIRLPIILRQFPFLFQDSGKMTPVFPSYPLPTLYTTEPITGLIYTSPFVLFGILPIVALMVNILERRRGAPPRQPVDQDLSTWMIISLGGTFLSTFLVLLMLFYASPRYLEDFMPALVMLSIIGFWHGYLSLRHNPARVRLYSWAAFILASLSIIMGCLLAISANIQRFQLYNPALMEWLVHIFPH